MALPIAAGNLSYIFLYREVYLLEVIGFNHCSAEIYRHPGLTKLAISEQSYFKLTETAKFSVSYLIFSHTKQQGAIKILQSQYSKSHFKWKIFSN